MLISSMSSGLFCIQHARLDEFPTNSVVIRLDGGEREDQNVRLAVHVLPDGKSLVNGRQIDEITEIAQVVVPLGPLVREIGDLSNANL
jgi:hypothetical protein